MKSINDMVYDVVKNKRDAEERKVIQQRWKNEALKRQLESLKNQCAEKKESGD